MDLAVFAAGAAALTGLAFSRAAAQPSLGGEDERGVPRAYLDVLRRHTALGEPIRRAFYLKHDDHLNTNHGSYGTAARPVVAAARRAMEGVEAWPDLFFRREGIESFIAVSDAVGAWVGAPRGSVALIDNATQGVNMALRTCARDLGPGDVLLVNDHTYGACRNACVDTAERAGARVVCAKLPFPILEPEELVAGLLAAVEGVLAEGGRLRLVLLDHITSPTALVLPVARIAAEVKARAPGALVVVDGAHCPLQMHLDIARDMPHVDFYTGNLHKWTYALKVRGSRTPRGGWFGDVAGLAPPTPAASE